MFYLDIQRVTAVIRHVAQTEIMPRFRRLAPHEVREKDGGDFVTVADEAAEKALIAALTPLLPGCEIVSEEEVAKEPALLERLKGDKPLWVIDPLDGTGNFARGNDRFGVLVSVVQRNEVLYGWLYDAPRDRMGVAVKGAGATLNGAECLLKKKNSALSKMRCMGGGGQAPHFEKISPLFGSMTHVNSSLHDYMAVASGEADALIHINEARPWDHLPGALLIAEAGGHVALNKNEPLKAVRAAGPTVLIAASSETAWQEIYEATKTHVIPAKAGIR